MTCSKCGTCCRFIALGRTTIFSKDQKDYLRTHGVVEDQGFFLIPFPCPHLAGNLCDIHDNKPKTCTQFDGKRYKNHSLYWVPKECTLNKKVEDEI